METVIKENLENPTEENEEKKIKIACQKIEKLLKKIFLRNPKLSGTSSRVRE